MKKEQGWSPLQPLIHWDNRATSKFIKYVDSHYGPLIKYNSIFIGLEISCHGILWLASTAAMMFLINFPSIKHLSSNLFLALLIDIVLVAVVKASIQRINPLESENLKQSKGKYSFPSGHAARSTMLTFLLFDQFVVPFPLRALLLAWSIGVCVSRLLSRRHYLLDVVIGMVMGWLTAVFVNHYVWLSADSADALIDFFLDESRVGASYDV